jgi:hypothetical protein
MRERVALAITLVRESVKALIAMPFLIIFPIFQCVVFGAFTVLWAVYSLYIVSSGNLTTETDDITGDSYKVFSYDRNAGAAFAFLLFAWVWNTAFVEALGQLLTSHAVLVWYFAPNRKQVSNMQVVQSAAVCARYHTGTAAFGSLLVALLQYLRLCLDYLRGRLQNRASLLARLFLCMLSCLIFCFEKCLQFVCDAAYVQCAMHGTPFCTSAVRGVSLIARNLGRVSTVTAVAVFVVFVGKLSIALSTSLAAYLYFTNYMSNDLNGPIMASLLVGYIAYQTSSLFLNVISATANTILQAYLIEQELGPDIEASTKNVDCDDAVEHQGYLSDGDMQIFMTELKESTVEINASNWNVLYDHRSPEIEMAPNNGKARTADPDKFEAVQPSAGGSFKSVTATQTPIMAPKPVKIPRKPPVSTQDKSGKPAFDTSTATPMPRRQMTNGSAAPPNDGKNNMTSKTAPITTQKGELKPVSQGLQRQNSRPKREFGWA